MKCEVTNVQQFNEIWLVDFEFAALSGAVPEVRCVVALEYNSGRKIRLWVDELGAGQSPRMPLMSTLYLLLIMPVLR